LQGDFIPIEHIPLGQPLIGSSLLFSTDDDGAVVEAAPVLDDTVLLRLLYPLDRHLYKSTNVIVNNSHHQGTYFEVLSLPSLSSALILSAYMFYILYIPLFEYYSWIIAAYLVSIFLNHSIDRTKRAH
jgi:hypothetical protein